jgi:hypothetical protein
MPMIEPKEGDLMVWHIPQVPGTPFQVPVRNIREAKLVDNALCNYDNFEFTENIKGDFSNAGGLNVYSNDIDGEGTVGWMTWYSEEGYDFDEVNEDGVFEV